MILNHFMVKRRDGCRITKCLFIFHAFQTQVLVVLTKAFTILVHNSHCLWYAHEKNHATY